MGLRTSPSRHGRLQHKEQEAKYGREDRRDPGFHLCPQRQRPGFLAFATPPREVGGALSATGWGAALMRLGQVSPKKSLGPLSADPDR